MVKVKISVTIDEVLSQWLEEQVESKRFATKSHGVELGLSILKKKIEKGEKIEYDFKS